MFMLEIMFSRELWVKRRILLTASVRSDAWERLLSEFDGQANVDGRAGLCVCKGVCVCVCVCCLCVCASFSSVGVGVCPHGMFMLESMFSRELWVKRRILLTGVCGVGPLGEASVRV